jgi:hypothetical protein
MVVVKKPETKERKGISPFTEVETTSKKRGQTISPSAAPFLFMYLISFPLTTRVDRARHDRNTALLLVPLHAGSARVKRRR